MATTTTKKPLEPYVRRSTPISVNQQHESSFLSSINNDETSCIVQQYTLNKHIHAAFEAHHHQSHRDGGNSSLVAYYFGLKYLEIALLDIPQNASFYSCDNTLVRMRQESTINASQVCNALQDIIANEPQMFAKESRKIEILYGLVMEQFENLSYYEKARKRAVDHLKKVYPGLDRNGS